MELVPLLSAAGIGGIVSALLTSLINGWLNGKNQRLNFEHQQRQDEAKRRFDEKKEAYIGFLEAYRQVAIQRTEKTLKEFSYWQIRCEIAGSDEVVTAISTLRTTTPNSEARDNAQSALVEAIRRDLGFKIFMPE